MFIASTLRAQVGVAFALELHNLHDGGRGDLHAVPQVGGINIEGLEGVVAHADGKAAVHELGTAFGLFGVFFMLMFLLVAGVIIYTLVKGARQGIHNSRSP